MKLQTIIYALILLAVHNLNAQELTLKAIPYPIFSSNNPLNYEITSDSSLRLSAPAHTDLFISPDGGFKVNSAPRLLFEPDSDFIFTSKIQLDFLSKWDAGVLLVYVDSTHFAKFCFEKDYTGQPRVVSVVCNETCDDCNGMPINDNYVYYRIIGSKNGKAFTFYYSADAINWFLIRSFKLDKIDKLRLGFCAQSPAGERCSVEFSKIKFENKKPEDFWKGK